MSATPKNSPSTAALLNLLRSEDLEVACGASLVIGALRLDHPRVVPALLRALRELPLHVHPYLLDALGHLGNAKALQSLVPYLLVEGTLREQAIRLVAGWGLEALPALRQLQKRDPVASTYSAIRVASEINHPEALDFLLDFLPQASFEGARNLNIAIRKRAPSLTKKLKRHLALRLRDLLNSGALEENVTGQIAAVKILGHLEDPSSLTVLLRRVEKDQRMIVRFNGLEILSRAPALSKRRQAVIAAVAPILDDASPRLIALAVKVLRRLEPPGLQLSKLMELARSPYAAVAQEALRDLRHHPPRDVLDTLMEALRAGKDSIVSAAAGSLSALGGATEALVAAHEDPRFSDRQGTIREILRSHSPEMGRIEFRRMARRLLADDLDEETLRGRLLVLGHIDRVELNRMAESRARSLLTNDQASRSLLILEPLVKNRLATPAGRYLLAVAHLHLMPLDGESPDEHLSRALQLLGPLSRLQEWALRPRILRERLSPERIHHLAIGLEQRGAPEQSLAEALRAKWNLPRED